MGYYENIYNGGKLSGVSILKMKKEQICIWLAWAGQQEEISLFLFFCVTNSGLLDAWVLYTVSLKQFWYQIRAAAQESN